MKTLTVMAAASCVTLTILISQISDDVDRAKVQTRQNRAQLAELKKTVACLLNPHGESSVTATKVNGKWIVSKPTRTGC